jgi:outer membrane autotransporter protein
VIDQHSGISVMQGLASGDKSMPTEKYLWIKPFVNFAEQEKNNGVGGGYQANTAGLAFGSDDQLNESIRAGLAVAVANSKINGTNDYEAHSQSVTSYQLSLYGHEQFDQGLYSSAKLSFGWNKNYIERDMLLSGTAHANYQSWYGQINIDINKIYTFNDVFEITPRLSMNYLTVGEEGYHEHGSSTNLIVHSRHEDFMTIMLGAQFKYQFPESSNGLKKALTAHVDVGYNVTGQDSKIAAQFEAGGPVFKTYGNKLGSIVIRNGVGIIFSKESNWGASVSYDVISRDKYLDKQLSATIRYKW